MTDKNLPPGISESAYSEAALVMDILQEMGTVPISPIYEHGPPDSYMLEFKVPMDDISGGMTRMDVRSSYDFRKGHLLGGSLRLGAFQKDSWDHDEIRAAAETAAGRSGMSRYTSVRLADLALVQILPHLDTKTETHAPDSVDAARDTVSAVELFKEELG